MNAATEEEINRYIETGNVVPEPEEELVKTSHDAYENVAY